MSVWETYPSNYRQPEVQTILTAIRAGESVSLLGLSGAGKSNLLGFLANRITWEGRFVLVDGNRLAGPTPTAFYQLMHQSLTDTPPAGEIYPALAGTVDRALAATPSGVCFLLDRFDALEGEHTPTITSNLRALRDAHKYRLTFVFATRRPFDPLTEIAELVFANTLWLGTLNDNDVFWNIERFAARKHLTWDAQIAQTIHRFSGGYPSFLRAVCEAYALGCPLELDALREHPAIARRVAEFWSDEPTPKMITLSGLRAHPLLGDKPPQRNQIQGNLRDQHPAGPISSGLQAETSWDFDPLLFSAKEQLLLEYLISHPNQVCEKDSVIRAIWPEDKIYTEGVRDDSLAQLVRRVRVKIEADPSNPQHLHTVPGRGYLFKP